MTSHFDRYHSMKPVDTRCGSIQAHENSFVARNKANLLRDAKTALAWGTPDNESTGYSRAELMSIINRLVKYIEAP